MSDLGTSVLTPEQVAQRQAAPPVKSRPALSGKEFLFDSIAKESVDTDDATSESSWSPFFTGLLWVGYATALAVALVLVWSAARELLR